MEPSSATRHPSSRQSPRFRRAAAAIAALLIALVASCADESEPADSGIRGGQLQPPSDIGSLTLPDVTNAEAAFPITARPGGLLVVFFGYTACPDFCPTTLADVGQALDLLDPAVATKVDVAMVSVDPANDTPEKLADFVTTFVEGGHGLRTDDPDALLEVTDAFGARFNVLTTEDGIPEVEHTVTLFGVDDAHRVVVQWTYGTMPDDLAHDLTALVDGEAT